MAYNKFITKDGTVMLDLTDTTVSAETLSKNITAVDRSGNKIIGTLTDSHLPIEVSTEAEMAALLETGKGGSIYKYVGTSGTYENGALYIIKETYYLTFTSNSPFTLTSASGIFDNDGIIQYSTDAINWNNVDFNSDTISSSDSGVLYLRGIGNTVITGYPSNIGDSDSFYFDTDDYIYCSGNIENLLDYETVMRGEHPPMGDYCFSKLFAGNTMLITAPELPATTLADCCYYHMFEGCTDLTTPPELPATTLADCCYEGMFTDCTNLTTPPELPATTLADGCYMGMFMVCTSLTTPPQLPATTLAEHCYNNMFSGCTNLTTLPKLPATTLVENCYFGMFTGCTNIKLSTTQTGEYQNAYRIPSSGNGIDAEDALDAMFIHTGGTFTGTPTINTTYYTSNEVV